MFKTSYVYGPDLFLVLRSVTSFSWELSRISNTNSSIHTLSQAWTYACWIITGNYHFHLIQDTEMLRYESYSDVQWQRRKIFLFPLCFSLVWRLSCCAVLKWLQYWLLILLLSLGFIYKSEGMDLGNWSEWETVCCTCLSSNCESFTFL